MLYFLFLWRKKPVKLNSKHSFILVFVLFISTTFANTVTLKKHSTIPVRLAQNINGNIDNQGDGIYFEVLEDVTVDNEVVVRKGTFVKGKITNAETRKSMGKAGKLTIDARSLPAVDGQMIDIVRDEMTSEGRKRTGATVAHVIMWGPIGLLAKGRAARIMMDTEYDIEVESDVTIDTSIKTQAEDLTLEKTSVNVSFKKYKRKINYAKGKEGKSFVLYVTLPEATNLGVNNISITEILGHKLPNSILPTSVVWDKKTNAFAASIPFISMVKFLSPGTSSVKVQVKNNNLFMIGETVVETKWKLK